MWSPDGNPELLRPGDSSDREESRFVLGTFSAIVGGVLTWVGVQVRDEKLVQIGQGLVNTGFTTMGVEPIQWPVFLFEKSSTNKDPIPPVWSWSAQSSGADLWYSYSGGTAPPPNPRQRRESNLFRVTGFTGQDTLPGPLGILSYDYDEADRLSEWAT